MKHPNAWLWVMLAALFVAAAVPLSVHAASDGGVAKNHKADAG
jgi:hypothetical protein